MQLDQEMEKSRVLEKCLRVLAHEHLSLEQSISLTLRTSNIELNYMRSVHWSFAMCLGPAGAVRSGDGKVACPGGVSPGAGPRAPVPGTVHQLTEDLVGSHHCSDHAYVAALCQLTICCPVFRHGRVLRLW